MRDTRIREAVREHYGAVVQGQGTCCGTGGPCCDTADPEAGSTCGSDVYSAVELGSVPAGSDMGLGCGNPLALAALREGDTVLDLGSGGGVDCFLAARRVGAAGRVIGVDMTPSMIDRAREIAKSAGYANVEFRLGEIEHLPVADASVDLIISNCVINLSVDKKRVFQEAFRVLKPGGALMISDIVLLKELPERVRNSLESYSACLSGALRREQYLRLIRNAGFEEPRIVKESGTGGSKHPSERAGSTLSITVTAKKPG